jgi:hypothetical protein
MECISSCLLIRAFPADPQLFRLDSAEMTGYRSTTAIVGRFGVQGRTSLALTAFGVGASLVGVAVWLGTQGGTLLGTSADADGGALSTANVPRERVVRAIAADEARAAALDARTSEPVHDDDRAGRWMSAVTNVAVTLREQGGEVVRSKCGGDICSLEIKHVPPEILHETVSAIVAQSGLSGRTFVLPENEDIGWRSTRVYFLPKGAGLPPL